LLITIIIIIIILLIIIIIIIIYSIAFSIFNKYDLSMGTENATKLSTAEKPPF